MNYKECKVNNSIEVLKIMEQFDEVFPRKLSTIVPSMKKYAEKVFRNAEVYACKLEEETIGYIVFYCNDLVNQSSYISQLAVKNSYRNCGIGKKLLEICKNESIYNNMKYIRLEVDIINSDALRFYSKNNFKIEREASKDSMYMKLEL